MRVSISKPHWKIWKPTTGRKSSTSTSRAFISATAMRKQFRQQGSGGVIVNSGSIHSLVARPGLAPYAASKGGVKLLTQQIASEVSKDGIRAVAIAPGYIRTPLMDSLSKEVVDNLVNLHPIGRLGEPIEVARTVLFLASDDASFITGITLPIDGGYTAV